MSTAKRIEWIDVAKGLGLFLVVVGHAMTTPIRDASFLCYAIYTAIYFFHMPFMFYLSGRTFTAIKNSTTEYISPQSN